MRRRSGGRGGFVAPAGLIPAKGPSTADERPEPRSNFDHRAASYDELRPVDEHWWELFDALVRFGDLRGRRILEVGPGPGRLAAALVERASARVWAVDSSPAMIDEARRNAPPGVRFKVADAEHLPFKGGWFERVVIRMTVHLLDRPRAFPELRRVLAEGGRAVMATLDPSEFSDGWLAPFFPSLIRIDEQRFPSAEALEHELAGAGFTSVSVERLPQRFDVPRAQALEQIRGRAFSTFDLIPEDELHAGTERAEAELPERVRHARTWLIAVADR